MPAGPLIRCHCLVVVVVVVVAAQHISTDISASFSIAQTHTHTRPAHDDEHEQRKNRAAPHATPATQALVRRRIRPWTLARSAKGD